MPGSILIRPSAMAWRISSTLAVSISLSASCVRRLLISRTCAASGLTLSPEDGVAALAGAAWGRAAASPAGASAGRDEVEWLIFTGVPCWFPMALRPRRGNL
ncbi:hypothetical protein CO2235_U1010027 [Cupriavidus oxalaticus]|uniref:Uncharacterized protein n=1 Tax=Cupriavidus oxalaticus TaxID=96344 RepID=A0A375FNE2_9BURK|nr:hypothetical protein CO2235_U1010027 [Cupriavidus oxalaticus]